MMDLHEYLFSKIEVLDYGEVKYPSNVIRCRYCNDIVEVINPGNMDKYMENIEAQCVIHLMACKKFNAVKEAEIFETMCDVGVPMEEEEEEEEKEK